jgi:plasmid stabilization system protein ParE
MDLPDQRDAATPAGLRTMDSYFRFRRGGQISHENYLLYYLEREDSVDVIRVLHGARDIPEALQS